jgi:phosphoribosyl-dephospho-CoA transferase
MLNLVVKRHDLVRLTPEGWETVCLGLSGVARDLARRWGKRELPAVVRRTEPGTPADMLCLGIPAPPDALSGQKLRVGFVVERRHVAVVRPPLALIEATVPAAWQAAFATLSEALRGADIDCRVFGSVAMQTLTGERYLRPESDIDLLLRPTSSAQLDAGLDLLRHHAQSLPLDGEIEFPSGHAVSWKEWHGADRVLAKHLDTVALLRCDQLLAKFVVPLSAQLSVELSAQPSEAEYDHA